MNHLSPDELVDLIEGTLAGDRAAHVRSCEPCRRQADDLRATLAEARGVSAPEPSPLFWEHFSTRVREAVAAEQGPRSRRAWLWRPAYGLAVALALVLVIVTAALWRPAPRPVTPSTPVAAREDATADPIGAIEIASDDRSWDLVTTVAADLAWDDAEEAGLTPRPGAADRAVLMLTAEERSELARLLKAELPRTQS